MTTRRKKKSQDGFLKKVSSLFNLDSVSQPVVLENSVTNFVSLLAKLFYFRRFSEHQNAVGGFVVIAYDSFRVPFESILA